MVDGMKWVSSKLRLVFRAAVKFDGDHGFLLSAGITFNILLCLIPLTLLMLSVIGYLFTREAVLEQIRNFILQAAPSLDPEVMGVISDLVKDRRIIGIVGIGGLVWISTWVFGSLRSALNIIMGFEKGRSFLHGLAIDICMVVMVIILLLTSMSLTSFVTYIEGYGLPFHIGPILQWLMKYLLPLLFTYWMFFLIYKIIPDRRISFRTALFTALFTSVLWETAKHFFGWYILHLSRFPVLYGSLSALVVFLFWLYYSSIILLLGGEVAHLSQKEKQSKAEDRRG
jgi:membrane protein